jgi:hypothetical protein
MIDKAIGVALSLAFLGASGAAAQTIFGAAYNGPNAPATLYTISPVNGAATVVGPIGAANVSSIAFAPDGVTLYGVGMVGGNFTLLRINPSIGAGTPIGPTNLAGPCQDMAFRSDGKLFCYSGGSIFTLSTSTGASTFVGDTGDFPLGNALAFSSGNILYTANEVGLDSVNQSTGAITLVVHLTYSPAFGGTPRASAMKFHPNGTLYASVISGFIGPADISIQSGPASLGIINISTGAVTRVGPTVAGLDALAISTQTIVPNPSSVPAPSSWLLVVTGLALVVVYFAGRRRVRSLSI